MATPVNGAISMLDFRTEITRGTEAISMSEVRDRYGGSGSISFNSLYKCEGFTVDPVNFFVSSKFFSINVDGFDRRLFGPYGAVTPNDSDGVQVTANAYIYTAYANAGTSDGVIGIVDAATGFSVENISVGWRGENVSRVVTNNVSRSITAATSSTVSYTYDWPTTGSIPCLVQFTN